MAVRGISMEEFTKKENCEMKNNKVPFFLLVLFILLIFFLHCRVSRYTEEDAIKFIKAYFKAQQFYRTINMGQAYATVEELNNEGLIEPTFAESIASDGTVGISGYFFKEKVERDEAGRIIRFEMRAGPVRYGGQTRKQFYLSHNGWLYHRDIKKAGIPDIVGGFYPGPPDETWSVSVSGPLFTGIDIKHLQNTMIQNEENVISIMEAYFSAQLTYRAIQKDNSYGTAEELLNEKMLEPTFANSVISGEDIPFAGYTFSERTERDQYGRIISFILKAGPMEYNIDGRKQFYLSSEGYLYARDIKKSRIPDIGGVFHYGPPDDTWSMAKFLHSGDYSTPGLSMIIENEKTAVKHIRNYFSSQNTYRSVQTPRSFATADELKYGGFLESNFADAIISNGKIPIAGYVFSEKTEKDHIGRIIKFELKAGPLEYDIDGRNQFYISSSGSLWTRDAKESGIPYIEGEFHIRPPDETWSVFTGH